MDANEVMDLMQNFEQALMGHFDNNNITTKKSTNPFQSEASEIIKSFQKKAEEKVQELFIEKIYDLKLKHPFNKKEDISYLTEIWETSGYKNVINSKEVIKLCSNTDSLCTKVAEIGEDYIPYLLSFYTDFNTLVQPMIMEDIKNFLIAWLLGNTKLMKIFKESNYDINKQIIKHGKSESLALKFTNVRTPKNIQNWLKSDSWRDVCESLINLMGISLCKDHEKWVFWNKWNYRKEMVNIKKKLPDGVGWHQIEHLLQAWYYVLGKPHPSNVFVHMYRTGGEAIRTLKMVGFNERSLKLINHKIKKLHDKDCNVDAITLYPKLPIDVLRTIPKFKYHELDYGQLSYYMDLFHPEMYK